MENSPNSIRNWQFGIGILHFNSGKRLRISFLMCFSFFYKNDKFLKRSKKASIVLAEGGWRKCNCKTSNNKSKTTHRHGMAKSYTTTIQGKAKIDDTNIYLSIRPNFRRNQFNGDPFLLFLDLVVPLPFFLEHHPTGDYQA